MKISMARLQVAWLRPPVSDALRAENIDLVKMIKLLSSTILSVAYAGSAERPDA